LERFRAITNTWDKFQAISKIWTILGISMIEQRFYRLKLTIKKIERWVIQSEEFGRWMSVKSIKSERERLKKNEGSEQHEWEKPEVKLRLFFLHI
jgi:hypothetical protein